MRSGKRYAVFGLAARLGLSVEEVEAMPVTRFNEWLIYFGTIEPELIQKASKRK